MYIPSNEIKQPRLHADTLGFTFVWNNHFLRGIYPSAVEQANGYFSSGFIDEVVSKGLFPKTWISEFENEQFGMIIEHEMISPVLYAMEWNFEMLKDAALMVLNIAQVGWKYGYNMVDCHKLNVLFKNNKPVYVDLGSFVPRQDGETGWKPYGSFLNSYYNILNVWSDGASQIAKRMMAPGLQFNAFDYRLYKRRVNRWLPRFVQKEIQICNYFDHIVAFGNQRFSAEIDLINSNHRIKKIACFVKNMMDKLKILPSQNLSKIERKTKRLCLPNKTHLQINDSNSDAAMYLKQILHKTFQECKSVTFIDCHNPLLYQEILNSTFINRIVSLNQDETYSNAEYVFMRDKASGFCCAQFQLLNNSIMLAGKEPEFRLSSDIVVIPDIKIQKGKFGVHNAIVFIERSCLFSKYNKAIFYIHKCTDDCKKELIDNLCDELGQDWFLYERKRYNKQNRV